MTDSLARVLLLAEGYRERSGREETGCEELILAMYDVAAESGGGLFAAAKMDRATVIAKLESAGSAPSSNGWQFVGKYGASGDDRASSYDGSDERAPRTGSPTPLFFPLLSRDAGGVVRDAAALAALQNSATVDLPHLEMPLFLGLYSTRFAELRSEMLEADESRRRLLPDLDVLEESLSESMPEGEGVVAPSVRGDWSPLPPARCAKLLFDWVEQGTLTLFDVLRMSPRAARSRTMAMYRWGTEHDAGRLYEVAVRSPDGLVPGLFTVLEAAGTHRHLDGNSAPIHEMNEVSGMTLRNRVDALTYVTMFSNLLTGDRGEIFRILDGEGIVTFEPGASEDVRTKVRALFCEPILFAPGALNEHEFVPEYRFRCHVLYDRDISEARMLVKASGEVEVEDDTPVLENVPVLVERFDKGIRVLAKAPPLRVEGAPA